MLRLGSTCESKPYQVGQLSGSWFYSAHGGHNGAMETADRPWGTYTVLSDEENHKVKRITVQPGQRLSYQKHAKRSEHWFFLEGNGVVVLDDLGIEVGAGSAVDIPAETAHRIENPGETPLVFIEVQHGSYFGEDDIIRLEDDYGRVESST